jgi:hypothetical protein
MGQPDRTRTVQALLLLASVLAVALAGQHLWRAYLRLSYPYDLNFWSEDFLMTSMAKLQAGKALYGPIAAADSSVYGPGQALLHYAMLAPFKLAGSVVAHKVLGHVFALLAVVVATVLGLRLTEHGAAPKALRAAVLAPAFAACMYMNPVVDGLHPGNLEAGLLGSCALACARLPDLRTRVRRALLLLLPLCALLVKQNSGVVVLASLALACALGKLDPRQRKIDLLLIGASAALAALTLQVAFGEHYWDWAVRLLAAHPMEWQRVRGFGSGLGPLFASVFVVAAARTALALRRRGSNDAAWLRVAVVAGLYLPAAVLAQLKTRGGANNTASLGFVLALVALPALVQAILAAKAQWLRALSALTLVGTLLCWHTQRYVPNARDVALAESICGFAAIRMQCGESVWLARGASCYARADELPRDRMPSVTDVVAAGRFSELGLLDRLQREQYDVILLHEADMRLLGQRFWEPLNAHYRPFYAGQEQAAGDYWLHGFQGWGSRRVLFFERKRDAGKHRADPSYGCAGAER